MRQAAEVHWVRVWDALAASATVIAPDLRGRQLVRCIVDGVAAPIGARPGA